MKIKLKHVEISRPYYHGWVYNKVSAWRESIDTHLLRLHQVRSQNIYSQYLFFCQSGIMLKPKKKLFASFDKLSGFNPEDNIEKKAVYKEKAVVVNIFQIKC